MSSQATGHSHGLATIFYQSSLATSLLCNSDGLGKQLAAGNALIFLPHDSCGDELIDADIEDRCICDVEYFAMYV